MAAQQITKRAEWISASSSDGRVEDCYVPQRVIPSNPFKTPNDRSN
jgi:D-alanyl-D-alanine dipeptidase